MAYFSGLSTALRSVVWRVGAGVLLLNLFVFGTVAWSLYQSRQEYLKRAEVTAQNLSRVLAESIAGDIGRIDVTLLAAADQAAGGLRREALNAFLFRQQERLPEILSLRATDANAIVQFGGGVDPAARPNNSDRDYFILQRDNPEVGLVIAKPVFAHIDKEWVIPMSRPIRRPDGSFGGVVYANVGLAYLSRMFSSLDIEQHGVVALRNEEMGVIARYPEPPDMGRFSGDKMIPPELSKLVISRHTSGTFHAVAPVDHVARTVSFRRIAKYPLYVTVGLAQEDFLANWRREAVEWSALAALFALMTAALSWRIHSSWRRQLEVTTELAREEEKFRTMADYTADWEYWQGVSNAIMFMSPSCQQMTGYTQTEFHIDPDLLNRIVHPDDRDMMAGHVHGAASGCEGSVDFRIVRCDGEIRWIGHSCRAVLGRDGVYMGQRVSNRDITERKHMEEELQRAKEEAEKASRAAGEFLSNMSHEIRTPMNSVLGMAQLALDIETNPKKRDYLKKIQLSGGHLMGIIDDILDFSQIEAGKLSIEEADFYFHEVKNKLADMFTHKAVEKGLKLTFDFHRAIPHRLRGDPLRLSEILLNYISNAIKFTERGEITVRARRVEQGRGSFLLRFEVQDTGVGISAEDMTKLFQPFQQADGSITRKYGGSGLGLVISKRLAELMGGEVGVESEMGKGCTFWFTARLGKGRARRKNGPPIATEAEMVAAIKGARFLLVEDDDLNQEVATTFLQRAGAEVFIARNGREAFDLLRNGHFDCVLMDVQMPVMGGLEAIGLIRSDPALAGLRVIAMTANASNRDRERFLKAGMDDFISKPFKSQRLYATVSKWLSRRAPQASFTFAPAVPDIEAALPHGQSIIDFAEVAEFVGDDPMEMHAFVSRFIESAKTDVGRIEAAAERNDMAEVSAIAHRMFTPAMMVGARGFADLCRKLDGGKNGEGTEQELVCQLAPLLERIEEHVKERLVLSS